MMGELENALSLLASALEQLRIPYLIGGSVASSVRGVARGTRDIDIVARIVPLQAGQFVRTLGRDWYADADQIRQAIHTGLAFNVIYMPKSLKIDIFPAVGEFHATQLERASKIALSFLDIDAEYPVASAEDILLAKLQWYRSGGEVSDRQWYDIGGLLETNPDMDFAYINSWAVRLNVQDLLAKALAEVQNENDSTVL